MSLESVLVPAFEKFARDLGAAIGKAPIAELRCGVTGPRGAHPALLGHMPGPLTRAQLDALMGTVVVGAAVNALNRAMPR